MRCLWLTLADPDPPQNGQFLYSSGLIRAAARAGMDLQVVGFALPRGQHRDGQRTGAILWRLAEHRPRSRWRGIFSALPLSVSRTKTPALRSILQELLAKEAWDVVVFDAINLGWALAPVRQHYRRRQDGPKLVYLSHNHEASLASGLLQDVRNPLRRAIRLWDVLKLRRCEGALLRHTELVTANTPEDCARFRAERLGKATEFLSPGYSGHVLRRGITTAIPRRAVIVGSFDWSAKRDSLEAFLRVADPLFAQAGIELYVVGQAEKSYLARLRPGLMATTFTGRVADVSAYMEEARLALVIDRTPGFKLKGLDYVFHRLPIFALAGSLPGMPLVEQESARFFSDYRQLADSVCQAIDDVAALDRLQDRAYAVCADQFDWDAIGKRLVGMITRTGDRKNLRARAGTMSQPIGGLPS